ncbi:MAG: TetR/AcrR family transcriptional regulator [Candidatus Sericytochromatia bacterium]
MANKLGFLAKKDHLSKLLSALCNCQFKKNGPTGLFQPMSRFRLIHMRNNQKKHLPEAQTNPQEPAVKSGPFFWDDNNRIKTREKLVLGALRLLAEGGADGFGLNTVLKQTGLSKGAFYHYFDSLEALLFECLKYRKSERLVKAEENYLQYRSFQAFLFDYFEQMFSFSASSEFLNILLYFYQKGLNQNQIRAELCRNNRLVLERLAQIIQSFYPQTIEKQRLQSIAAQILFTVEGVSAHSTLEQSSHRFRGTWEWLIQAIIRDLAAYE